MGATPRLITALVIAAVFAGLFIAELRRPLRPSVESKLRRTLRNLTNGGLSLAIVVLLQTPVLLVVAQWASERRIGILHLVELPSWIEIALAVLLLDYTLWIWHWANHVVPVLWRFHLVHHVDLDLDASTAFRFHFGEMALSVIYRSLQVLVVGADLYAVGIWSGLLLVSILFHHSNIRLPIRLERWLVPLVVTPRMHGIHHSTILGETNSNWSSMFTVWDYLHGTLRLDVPQGEIAVGVPAYRSPDEVTIGKILLIPFIRQRKDWHVPDGTIRTRQPFGDRRSLAE